MNALVRRSLPQGILLAVIVVLGQTGTSQAQKKAPVPVNPQAPVLKPVVPLGAQRGTTLDLTLTGSNLAEPTGLWTSFPAKVTIPKENNNGKDNAKLLVRLEVPRDAPLGFHGIRLATRRGMSNLGLFCIDDLPQVLETTTNRSPSTAQAVPAPCVVVGKADAEVTDYFKFTVKAGQRLSFEVLGRRLGSQFDPQLALLDARSSHELPGAYSNDSPGMQTDPRLRYTFKTAGDYLVAIRDVSYRGGDDFNYRLRIGDFPCATTPLPLAVKHGSKVAVQFAGPNVEQVAPVEVTAPSDPTVAAIQVAPRGANGLYGWPVTLALSDLDETLEKEPNNEPAKASRLAVPAAVTGRFEHKGDKDYFVCSLKKGTRYILDVQTQELGSPTEVYMTLLDAKGAQLQASNPAAAARLDFTPKDDGDYTIKVEHLHLWGGPDETYRLTVTPYEPGFDLALQVDRFDAPQGGKKEIPLLLTRRDYTGPIEVHVMGPKGIGGQFTIAEKKTAPANQPVGELPLTVADDVPIGAYTFFIQGKATINGKVVTQLANGRAALSQSLANLPVPPRTLVDPLGLAVTEKPPFTLAAKFDSPSATPGKTATLTVTATRVPGFTEEVALTVAGLPANVTAAMKNIPAKQNEVKVTVTLAPAAAVGQSSLTITGKAKVQGREVVAQTSPVPLVIKK
jgi:hypothetical protein